MQLLPSLIGDGISAFGGGKIPAIRLSATSLTENSAQGTAIGTLSVVNATGTASFTLTDSAGNKIQLGGTNNVNVQAGATNTDFEITPTFTFSVSVSGVTPAISTKTFRINVVDVDEGIAPAAPIIDMDSAWDTTQSIPLIIGDADWQNNDDLQQEIKINGADWATAVITHDTVTTPEINGTQINFGNGALTNANYTVRWKFKHSGGLYSNYSNEVNFTIAAVSSIALESSTDMIELESSTDTIQLESA